MEISVVEKSLLLSLMRRERHRLRFCIIPFFVYTSVMKVICRRTRGVKVDDIVLSPVLVMCPWRTELWLRCDAWLAGRVLEEKIRMSDNAHLFSGEDSINSGLDLWKKAFLCNALTLSEVGRGKLHCLKGGFFLHTHSKKFYYWIITDWGVSVTLHDRMVIIF